MLAGGTFGEGLATGETCGFRDVPFAKQKRGYACSARSSPDRSLRLPVKFNLLTLSYRSFIFLIICAFLVIPPTTLTPVRE